MLASAAATGSVDWIGGDVPRQHTPKPRNPFRVPDMTEPENICDAVAVGGGYIGASKSKGTLVPSPSVPAPRPNLGQALELSVRSAPEVRGSGARCEPDLLQPQS